MSKKPRLTASEKAVAKKDGSIRAIKLLRARTEISLHDAAEIVRGFLSTAPAASANKLKMWIGNLDGSRQGLVIASSKERARKIVRASHNEFDGYWSQQTSVDQALKPDVLYTRVRGAGLGVRWYQGRCPLPDWRTKETKLAKKAVKSTMVDVRRAKKAFDVHRDARHAVGMERCLVVVGYADGKDPFRLLARVDADLGLDEMPDPPLTMAEMQPVAFAAKMAIAKVLVARRRKTT